MSPHTPTSKSVPTKILLVKKEGCLPCQAALENLEYVLSQSPGLDQYVEIIPKEDRPDVVECYEIDLYPTVILCDDEYNYISRKVGSKFLTSQWWHAALTTIHLRNRKNSQL